MSNPLLVEWKTPFETPPFSAVKNNHFLPAIKNNDTINPCAQIK